MTRLCFDILSFWQVGTGAGEMGTFDSRAARDPLGLPLIPGRQVKGLCRQAVYDAESLGKLPAGTTILLFGDRAAKDQPLLPDPKPASLRFSDARLPDDTRAVLDGQHALIAGFYRSRRSTAMTERGTAKAHSLRFDEVVVPVKLQATVSPLSGAPADWAALLNGALPLLNAIGSGRTRGMGRVVVTLEG